MQICQLGGIKTGVRQKQNTKKLKTLNLKKIKQVNIVQLHPREMNQNKM